MKIKNLLKKYLLSLLTGLVVATTLAFPVRAFAPPKQEPLEQRGPIKLTISLYRSPVGADRLLYENTIRYFADAVYEMSNGVHKLGRVEIYSGGEYADRANIVWTETGWPQANISGYASEGQRVSFCDANTEGENYLLTDYDQQNGGYTLGHEWGHYYYSLYDEYVGSTSRPDDLGNPDPNDQPVQNSVMNNQRSAILGGNFTGDLSWLNFSTPLNSTQANAQRRVYEASAWETLARPPSKDPAEPPRRYDATRLYYPELAAVAPPPDQPPSIEIGSETGRTEARSELQIVWMAEAQASRAAARLAVGATGFVRQLVIDRSANMAANDKLANVKAAAQLLVDQAEIGDTIGIISYDSAVTIVQPLTPIVDQTTKDAIQAAIEGISTGDNGAAIGDAAQQALAGLTAAAVPTNTNRAVYLIAGSPDTTGGNPLAIGSAYQAAFVSLYTFGYEVDETTAATLQDLAERTDSEYHFIGGSSNPDAALNDLLDAFASADQAVSPIVDVNLTTGVGTVSPSTPLTIPIWVDDSLGELEVEVVYQGAQAGATLTLLNPADTPSAAPDCTVSDTTTDVDTLCFFSVSDPISGTWTLEANATATDINLEYWAGGVPKNDAFTFAAVVDSRVGETVSSDQAVILEASILKDLLPIAGSVVNATLEAPDGEVTEVTMRDDGVSPDRTGQDGIYTTQLDNLTAIGDYNLMIKFDNGSGTAEFTEESFAIGAGLDGKQRPPKPPVPVGENFNRFTEIQINVVPPRNVYLPVIVK